MSKVVLTLEFPTATAAADALNRMLGNEPQTRVVVDIPTITLPVGLPPAGQIVAQDAQSLPTTPAVVEKPVRKPRSDAGQPRGPHKDPAAPATPKENTEGGATSATPVSAAAVGAPAAADPNVKLTKEDATAALGRINKTPGLGMPACMEHLKQFGVNRISILPEKDFALFIKQADEKIAEHLAAAGKK